jgi:hypothetical protein
MKPILFINFPDFQSLPAKSFISSLPFFPVHYKISY